MIWPTVLYPYGTRPLVFYFDLHTPVPICTITVNNIIIIIFRYIRFCHILFYKKKIFFFIAFKYLFTTVPHPIYLLRVRSDTHTIYIRRAYNHICIYTPIHLYKTLYTHTIMINYCLTCCSTCGVSPKKIR